MTVILSAKRGALVDKARYHQDTLVSWARLSTTTKKNMACFFTIGEKAATCLAANKREVERSILLKFALLVKENKKKRKNFFFIKNSPEKLVFFGGMARVL